MTKLSVKEARNLASVFGEPHRHKTILLINFQKPCSQFDVLQKMDNLPKTYRVPRATLYRKVKELSDNYFLELIEERDFVKGNLRGTVRYYRLTFKGYLAAFIHAYLLFSDSTTPKSLKEKIEIDELNKIMHKLESSPVWSFVISFLKWHKNKGFDLTNAKIDIIYFALTLGLSMLEMPENISEKDLTALSEMAKQFGIIQQQDPKSILELLKTLNKTIPEFEKNLLSMFALKTGKQGLFFGSE